MVRIQNSGVGDQAGWGEAGKGRTKGVEALGVVDSEAARDDARPRQSSLWKEQLKKKNTEKKRAERGFWEKTSRCLWAESLPFQNLLPPQMRSSLELQYVK